MVSRGIVPRLVLSQRVLDKIARTANQFIADETGESMVGFVVPGTTGPEDLPTIYVVDTISPDEDETLRRTHTFQQGDDLQDEIIWWLQENWRLCREQGMDSVKRPLDARFATTPLRYLGDWHKQPGYMIQPSGGDLMTALAWLDDDDNQMEYLLVPIVTLGHPATTLEDEAGQVNYVTVFMGDDTSLRVDWWYIHRDVRFFQPITPRVMPAEELPTLASYGWQLLYPDRLDDEVYAMNDDGLFVSPLVWQADEDIPMELCFFCARAGSNKVILVITEWDYPQSPPRARVGPFERFDPSDDMYEVFESIWTKSEPVAPPAGFQWRPGMRLLDFVRAVEDELGIPHTPPPQSFRRQPGVSIDVHIEDDETDDEVAISADDTPSAGDAPDERPYS